jgi:hypothetical protein
MRADIHTDIRKDIHADIRSYIYAYIYFQICVQTFLSSYTIAIDGRKVTDDSKCVHHVLQLLKRGFVPVLHGMVQNEKKFN